MGGKPMENEPSSTVETTAPATAPSASAVWRVPMALAAVFLWMIAWYWGTASEIASIWWRSDTFAHGLVVLPIFVWLVWRKRAWYAGEQLVSVPLMGAVAGMLGLGWLAAQLVNVSSMAHFTFAAMLVAGFAAALGWRVSRVLLFPLLFLFFGVPIGEFMLPVMMKYTADFTVAALRLTGIPVYQEGLFFIIPNGRWSVVEACSGVRYLVASLMIGALYAYLSYNRLSRRLMFMGVALAVPIVANWVRAYITVMIGHLFGNEAVEGFIHIIYGWVFFGIVVFLMLWIGSFWSEAAKPAPAAATVTAPTGSPSRYWLGLLPFVFASAIFPLGLRALEKPAQAFQVNLTAPAPASGWALADVADFSSFRPTYHGQRGEAMQVYRAPDGGEVALYMVYYAEQRPGAEMVMWGNGLISAEGARGERWRIMRQGGDGIELQGGRSNLDTATDGARRVDVWHWYRIDSQVVISDYWAKVLLALDRLSGRTDDSVFVAVMVDATESPELARERAQLFLRDHEAALNGMLDAIEAAGAGR